MTDRRMLAGAALALVWCSACRSAPAPAVPEPRAAPPAHQPVPAPAAPARRMPVFEMALPPGEGTPVYTAVAGRLALLREPYVWADTAAILHVTAGQELTVGAYRYQTLSPARVQARASTTISGRRLGSVRVLTREQYYAGDHPRVEIAVTPATPIEHLQDRAEGTCFVRVNGQVIDADACPTHDEGAFRVTGAPVAQLWIRVAEPGRPTGWVRVAEGVVKESGRRF